MEAVHQALMEAFGIPEPDRNIRIRRYEADEWLLPPGKSDRYVLVEVRAFAGRSAQAKGRLYALIVENLGRLGVPAGDVFVQLAEEPRENWGIRGGQRADLVDLGYEVKV
jgi:hypothetical protein